MPVINPPTYLSGSEYAARDDLLSRSSLLTALGGGTNGLTRRYGVAPGSFRAASASGWQLNLAGGNAFIQPADAKGAIACPAEDLTAVNVTPANASLARKDLVVARVDTATGTWSLVSLDGTPGSGSAPAVPALAEALYELQIPANATSLSLVNHVVDRRRYTVAAGGIVPSEGHPITGDAYEGLARWQGNPRTLSLYDAAGGAWVPQSRGDHSHAAQTGKALRTADLDLGSGIADERFVLSVQTSDVSAGEAVEIVASWTGFLCERAAGNRIMCKLRRGDGGPVVNAFQVATAFGNNTNDLDGGGTLVGYDLDNNVANPRYVFTMEKRYPADRVTLRAQNNIAATLTYRRDRRA